MTDNITPQAPQTRAPMTTEEIVNGLEAVKEVYQPRNVVAVDAAIQAVELLEQIEQDLRGVCRACKYYDLLNTQEPCGNCYFGSDHWEFRWPLGEEADQ